MKVDSSNQGRRSPTDCLRADGSISNANTRKHRIGVGDPTTVYTKLRSRLEKYCCYSPARYV
jgi:hypothetical protein